MSVKRLPPELEQQLIDAAWQVAQRAYAPYSGFNVGAAILTAEGEVFSGCNVECAAYPHGICAERAAVANAVAAGRQHYQAIAIVAHSANPTPPCGGCRQFLAEFESDLLVIYANGGDVKRARLSYLLPEQFEDSFLDSVTSD